MLTPQRIQELAEPVEDIYIQMTDELLQNIVKHVTAPTWTHTAAWEIQKLSELGQLTQENAAIINRHIKEIPKEVRESMEETRRITLDQIEGKMEKAAREGFLTPPARDSTLDVMRDLMNQAEDRLNLTNTTMLQSSLDYYTDAILQTARTVQEAQAKSEKLIDQTRASMDILNQAAADVATSTKTQRDAVADAIRQLSERGLTGFVDRAGRNWSPEAYVNMVVRTTVHNTAIESTRARMFDYGTDVFQISAHAGARPRCYPYQGWFCCWSRSDGGEIELGNGQTVEYVSIHETSYGEAAGIFGINCGHYADPIIPGVSIPSAQDNIQDKEENDRLYKESQEQRALERKIREAKRTVELLGDLATKEDRAKVREAQAAMREFINRTGLTRRPEREQVYTSGKPVSMQKTQSTEKERIHSTNSNIVQQSLLDSKTYKDKFNGITQSSEGDRRIYESAVEILKHRSGTNGEDLYLFDATDGKEIHRLTTSKAVNAVTYDEETRNAIRRAHSEGRKIIAMHNHPGGLPPSLDDGSSAFEHNYASGIVIGHNLEVWTYGQSSGKIDPDTAKQIHNEFNNANQLMFSFDFDEQLWYSLLGEFGMEVDRK